MKYIKLMRIKHWFKNLLIFVPLVFNRDFSQGIIVPVLMGFIAFCFIASVVYIFNDIQDVEKDRKHTIKCKRPIASGEISIRTGIVVMCFLLLAAGGILCFLYVRTKNIWILILPFVYVVFNVFYSKTLKNLAIIDVLILTSGFYIRTLFGAKVSGVTMSNWLYLVIIFGAFYLGFGKRRNEIIRQTDNTRKVLNRYTKEFLDKNMYVCLGLSIMSYSMWCTDKVTLARIGNNYLISTVPLITIIFFFYSLDIEKDSDGDPIEVIFSNKILMAMIGLYCILMFLLLYVVK